MKMKIQPPELIPMHIQQNHYYIAIEVSIKKEKNNNNNYTAPQNMLNKLPYKYHHINSVKGDRIPYTKREY